MNLFQIAGPPMIAFFSMRRLVLVLGGSADRESRCMRVVASETCPIWLSGPALTEDCLEVCESQGVDLEYLRVDYRALDTLSNFTSMVPDMKSRGFKQMILVTSQEHETRAKCIASMILPYYNIELSGVIAIPGSKEDEEGTLIVLRDIIRTALWLLVGLDISYPLIALIHPQRVRQRKRRLRDFSFEGKKCFDLGTSD